MIKRIAVAGCRNYNNYQEAKAYIDFCVQRLIKQYTLIFVSGGCRGADALGERYANENGWLVEQYFADWKRYGKCAGPIRNKQMAEVSDYVICFWDGKSRGTKSMIDFTVQLGKPIRVKKI